MVHLHRSCHSGSLHKALSFLPSCLPLFLFLFDFICLFVRSLSLSLSLFTPPILFSFCWRLFLTSACHQALLSVLTWTTSRFATSFSCIVSTPFLTGLSVFHGLIDIHSQRYRNQIPLNVRPHPPMQPRINWERGEVLNMKSQRIKNILPGSPFNFNPQNLKKTIVEHAKEIPLLKDPPNMLVKICQS